MKSMHRYLFTCIIMLAAFCVLAQDDYIVGQRDVLDIKVYGEEAMTTIAEVSSHGTITYWILGEIEVEGKSVAEIKQMLTDILGENYLKNPVVEVSVKKFRSKEITIQGMVRNPKSYILETNSISFLKLLSLAGGTNENTGSRAYIIRGGVNRIKNPGDENEVVEMDDRIEIDLNKLLRHGDLSQDKIIYGGDFVFVTSKGTEDVNINYIWVEGQVRTPGQVLYQEGITAFRAVIQAGGLNNLAAPNRTKINRKTPDGKIEIIKVPLKDIRNGKKPDVLLQPGDRITVPERIF